MVASTQSEDTARPPRDTGYTVLVAPDGLLAWLTVSPPEDGGARPDIDAARAALDQAGVVFGVDPAALSSAVGPALGTAVEVARGTPPQPGIDGWLEPLVSVNQQRHPRVDTHGHIDFRDRGAIPGVAPGAALMRRHPPQPGVSGRAVNGRELPVMPPKNLPFAVRLQGVEADPQDPDLLRASIAGQPILLRDGISVEPILRLETVDIASGNVDFVGSVEVRGDVQSGMRIRAGGDVTVSGTVESAEIVAGGDVVARGGVIGHAEGQDNQTAETGRITAKGSVRARYLENCVVLAEQSVMVDEAIIQCDVTAIDQIVAGKKDSGRGRIVGGFVRATAGVTAEVLGGPGSGETRVFVGVNPLIQQALDEHRQHLDAKLREHGELSKILKLLKTRPDKQEMAVKARLTLKKVNEEIAEIMEEQRRLEGQLQVADQARIVVSQRIHGGVMVAIGKKSRFVAEEIGAGVFVIANGELVYGDLAAYGG